MADNDVWLTRVCVSSDPKAGRRFHSPVTDSMNILSALERTALLISCSSTFFCYSHILEFFLSVSVLLQPPVDRPPHTPYDLPTKRSNSDGI
jgi:hypothetical protein